VKLIVTPEAAGDIEQAYHWYKGRSAELGQAFLAEVRRAFGRIQERPVAAPVMHRETRRLRLRRFPYGVFYRHLEERLVIVACFHARRDPRLWKARS